MPYRLRFNDSYNPKGPDGQGWNRLAIIPMLPIERCALRPKSRQAALDTLRGMAHYGVTTAYLPCTGSDKCANCSRATRVKEAWNPEWHIREDADGRVWLLGNVEKAFAGFGYCYPNWRALINDVAVPPLKRLNDKTGAYWQSA